MSKISQEMRLSYNDPFPHLFLAKFYDNGKLYYCLSSFLAFEVQKNEQIKIQTTSENLLSQDILYSYEVFCVVYIKTDNLFNFS